MLQQKQQWGLQTCTYLGAHGHLHWVFKLASSSFLPNLWAMILMWCWPFFVGLPRKHILPHTLGVLVTGPLALIYTEGSFEAGSIWCWTALISYVMLLIEPYLSMPAAAAAGEENAKGGAVKLD
jgi:hypothetical protein